MANVKGNALPAKVSISSTDILIVVDPVTGIAYRTTVEQFIQTGGLETFHYLTQTSPYYSSASGGSITIPDFDTDYPTLSANGIIRMQGYITVDGTEVEVDIIPVVTRVSGNITAATFNFGIDPASTITTFKLRMY